MLEEKREKFKKIENIIGKIFSELEPSPNQYTFNSLIFGFFSSFFLVNGNFVLALPFFLLTSFLDFIDGAVARFSKRETKRGAYLDTICDRYVEGMIFLGFLLLPLESFILPAKVWILIAFFGSLMTTYSKAAAKEKELVVIELKKGLVGRGERVILISLAITLGIFNPSLIIYPIIALAIFSNLTALQRILFSINIMR